ncbi:quinone oxidoreductase [Rhodobacteraceae bacterium MYP1-1]|uniref:Quinone oxidoreductase n=1 Tax=Halocynthiibacter styelae TaxID=2761955 RepID=A0A8J7LQ02_9RHOB|nr:quinone oxidoreductase [Paenihalocynthiibacter styelae]
MPAGIGVEGAGVIEALGPEATGFSVGDRVAYIGGPAGAYSELRNIPIARLVKLPDWITDEIAAATIFKGLTAEYLIHRCVPVQADQWVLFHAAAGGVGSLACQWLRATGARVIGTVGSEEKIEIARANGCEHVFLSHDPDLAQKVRDLSGGVHVVYDSIGADTFIASLDSLRPRGSMVSIGAASGPPPEVNVGELVRRGSLHLTRPSIAHYTADPLEYQEASNRLFDALKEGSVQPAKITEFTLSDAANAQRLIEARKTTGSVVLRPN